MRNFSSNQCLSGIHLPLGMPELVEVYCSQTEVHWNPTLKPPYREHHIRDSLQQ